MKKLIPCFSTSDQWSITNGVMQSRIDIRKSKSIYLPVYMLSLDQSVQMPLDAVIDTGATFTHITPKVRQAIHAVKIGECEIRGELHDIVQCKIQLPNGMLLTTEAVELDLGDAIIIGMNIICRSRLLITPAPTPYTIDVTFEFPYKQ